MLKYNVQCTSTVLIVLNYNVQFTSTHICVLIVLTYNVQSTSTYICVLIVQCTMYNVQVLIYVYLLYLSTSTNELGPIPDKHNGI